MLMYLAIWYFISCTYITAGVVDLYLYLGMASLLTAIVFWNTLANNYSIEEFIIQQNLDYPNPIIRTLGYPNDISNFKILKDDLIFCKTK